MLITPKDATVVILERGDLVLLGKKLTGEIGVGKYSAPGGKRILGEGIFQCGVRELHEEVGVRARTDDLHRAGFLTCFAGEEVYQYVNILRTTNFEGEPCETESMADLTWFPKDDLPYDQMYEADRHFFPLIFGESEFKARVYYAEKAKEFQRIEFYK